MHRWVLQGSWVSGAGDRTKINGLWLSLQEYGAVYSSVTRTLVGESAAWQLASGWFSLVLDFTRASRSPIWTTKLPQRYFCLYMHAQLHSHVWLFVTPQTIACQAPLFLEFCRQEYWSGFAFPSPRDLLHPGIKPMFLTSPALVGGFYHMGASPGKPPLSMDGCQIIFVQRWYESGHLIWPSCFHHSP